MLRRILKRGYRKDGPYHDDRDGYEDPVARLRSVSLHHGTLYAAHNNWGSLWIVWIGICAMAAVFSCGNPDDVHMVWGLELPAM